MLHPAKAHFSLHTQLYFRRSVAAREGLDGEIELTKQQKGATKARPKTIAGANRNALPRRRSETAGRKLSRPPPPPIRLLMTPRKSLKSRARNNSVVIGTESPPINSVFTTPQRHLRHKDRSRLGWTGLKRRRMSRRGTGDVCRPRSKTQARTPPVLCTAEVVLYTLSNCRRNTTGKRGRGNAIAVGGHQFLLSLTTAKFAGFVLELPSS